MPVSCVHYLLVRCELWYSKNGVDADTSFWTPITYSNSIPDAFNDQQTGLKSGDIVGDINHPSFYLQFDNTGTPSLTDGTLAFRVRLNEANKNKLQFNYNLFIGIDGNLDGALDFFVGVDNSPSGKGKICLWNAGSWANNSPSTTTLVASSPRISFAETLANYNVSLVFKTMDPSAIYDDVDGEGKTDIFSASASISVRLSLY